MEQPEEGWRYRQPMKMQDWLYFGHELHREQSRRRVFRSWSCNLGWGWGNSNVLVFYGDEFTNDENFWTFRRVRNFGCLGRVQIFGRFSRALGVYDIWAHKIIFTSSDVNHLTSWRLEPCVATGKSKFSWMNWRLWPLLTLQDFIFEPGSQRDFCSSWKMLTSGTKFI